MNRTLPLVHGACLLAAALLFNGCTAIVDHAADAELKADAKALHQDICVSELDYALFRQCLRKRGGTCTGDANTALPHTPQAASNTPITPVQPGASTTLQQSVAALPAGHPAQTAHAVLSHPLTQATAQIYNNVRALGTTPSGSSSHGSSSSGSSSSDTAGQGASCGSEPTLHVPLRHHHVRGFHQSLLKSIGTTAWQALANHCTALLAKHQNDPDLPALQADCRRAVFIHEYLAAYLDHGHFVEVQLDAAEETGALGTKAAAINTRLSSLATQITTIEGLFPTGSATLSSATATQIANQSALLAVNAESELERERRDTLFEDLVGVTTGAIAQAWDQATTDTRKVAVLASLLAQNPGSATATELKNALSALSTDLGDLKTAIGTSNTGAVGQAVTHINSQVTALNTSLSNLAHVPAVGFVSRDQQFQARLPAFQLVYEPRPSERSTTSATADSSTSTTTSGGTTSNPPGGTTLPPPPPPRWTVKDATTGTVVSSLAGAADLGIVTDTSGVGTGGQILSELARIFLEAIFDANEGLPSISAQNGGNPPTATTLPAPYTLAPFQTNSTISSGDLTKMTDINNLVALETRLLTSRLIALIPFLSLEVDEFVSEMVATSVRKAMEKATWCFYACGLAKDLDSLFKDGVKDVKDHLHEDLEHVKIRLHSDS